MAKTAQSTQQFVEIAEVKDGVIYLKNGSLRRILMVSGINFDLKSEEEQNSIILSYQNFLNSLDFSAQIVVHSRKLNIGGYLERLRDLQAKEPNELIQNQIEEYITFVSSLVEQNAIMEKNFFVVVPFDTVVIPTGGKKVMEMFGIGKNKSQQDILGMSREQQIAQLDQRTDQVRSGLVGVGLRSVTLNDEELIELFYNLYNPQTIEKTKLKIAEEISG